MSRWSYHRRCVICDRLFLAKRHDAFLCSPRCRKRHNRQTAKHDQFAQRQECIEQAKAEGSAFLAKLDAEKPAIAAELDQVELDQVELGQVELGQVELDQGPGMRLVRQLGQAWPKLPQWVKDMMKRFGRKYGETTS